MANGKDPTQDIRQKALQYEGVDQGTACTQSSFKVGKKVFLYVGEQGGRFKVMFKLEKSMAEAKKLSKSRPLDFQVGNSNWVTARFSTDKPLPKKLWTTWLEESYELSVGPSNKKKSKTR